jgi:hypothetical protein
VSIHGAGASARRLERLATLYTLKQFRQRDAERIGQPDNRGQTKVLPSGLQVPEHCPVHFAVVRELLLGFEAALNANFTDALTETP